MHVDKPEEHFCNYMSFEGTFNPLDREPEMKQHVQRNMDQVNQPIVFAAV